MRREGNKVNAFIQSVKAPNNPDNELPVSLGFTSTSGHTILGKFLDKVL